MLMVHSCGNIAVFFCRVRTYFFCVLKQLCRLSILLMNRLTYLTISFFILFRLISIFFMKLTRYSSSSNNFCIGCIPFLYVLVQLRIFQLFNFFAPQNFLLFLQYLFFSEPWCVLFLCRSYVLIILLPSNLGCFYNIIFDFYTILQYNILHLFSSLMIKI